MDISTASQTLLTKVKITSATQTILKRLDFGRYFRLFFQSGIILIGPLMGPQRVEQNVEAKKHKRH